MIGVRTDDAIKLKAAYPFSAYRFDRQNVDSGSIKADHAT